MDHFINQALIFIGATVLVVPIFHRLGFGAVLGYLIGGILVGPFGLGLISDSESVLHFAELGVVLLLFIIGLEIQPRKLWMMKRELCFLGGSQVILTTIVFTMILFFCGLNLTTSGVLGFGLSLSSTAFALQTITEKKQFNTEFGKSAFSILLTQDLFAIPALAVIPALGPGLNHREVSTLTLILIPSIILLLVVASRFLVKPLFRLIAKTRTREIFTAAALFIVLGVSSLMLQIGLSAALGTFLAGVLLADSEYRHELEADLEPFKSLLMGLFFISVGMGVSLDLILSEPVRVFSLALAYMAIKFFLIYGLGRANKQKHESAKLMALNIAQGGEFAFVIFGIAAQSKLVDQNVNILLTAVVTLSMALNPFLIFINEKFSDRKYERDLNPAYKEIKDESPEVIIAGFGRFGQTFGRILRAQGIHFVAIDHDPEQIELMEKFGTKVYYGDVSREDLLVAAGAARAKYFVLAIDDVEKSLEAVEVLKEHFPKLQIFARARNRGHAFDLIERGVSKIKREIFDSSVYFVKDLLVEMGYEKEKAEILVQKFRHHDELMLLEQYKVRKDDKNFISLSKQGAAQLEKVLSDESRQSYIKP